MFFSLLVISWVSFITEALPPTHHYYQGFTKSLSPTHNVNYIFSATQSVMSMSFSDEDDSVADASPSFDMDFADAMSKPIPEWYIESRKQREKALIEIKQNRQQIIENFKAKYEVTEEQKRKELDAKFDRIRERMRKQQKSELYIEKVMGNLNTAR